MNKLARQTKGTADMRRKVLGVINKKGLSVPEWQIMYCVSHKSRTGKEIAEIMGIDGSTVSKTKREMLPLNMIKEGYAKGETGKKISLTPYGRQLVNMFKLRVKKAMGE